MLLLTFLICHLVIGLPSQNGANSERWPARFLPHAPSSGFYKVVPVFFSCCPCCTVYTWRRDTAGHYWKGTSFNNPTSHCCCSGIVCNAQSTMSISISSLFLGWRTSMQVASLVHWWSIPYIETLAWASADFLTSLQPGGMTQWFSRLMTMLPTCRVLQSLTLVPHPSRPCTEVRFIANLSRTALLRQQFIVWCGICVESGQFPWRKTRAKLHRMSSCDSNKLCTQNIAMNALCDALDHIPSTFDLFSAVRARSRDADNKMLGLLCQSASF